MYLSPAPIDDDVRRSHASDMAARGFVMNLTHLWAWRPDVFDGFAQLRNQLTSNSTLSKRELAVIVSATASALGDSYCALAWGTMLAAQSQPDLAAAVLQGEENDAFTARDRALATWARRITQDPTSTGPGDVQALRDAGFTDREIAEATMFVAFRIAFSTVNNALGAQPDAQLVTQAPPQVAEAVNFGRPAQKPV
jgi:uncharacterized peroxidase-related enzyme